MSDSRLTPERVRAVGRACCYRNEELGPDHTDPEGAVIVEGLTATFGFHPERVAAHREEIAALLAELPDAFREGWSFLNMSTDRHGQLWTGAHVYCELLLVLGMAAGLAKYSLPREMWDALPGGMPYVQTMPEVARVG